MKYVKFPEANSFSDDVPTCQAIFDNGAEKIPMIIRKVLLTKPEVRAIAKNRYFFVSTADIFAAAPGVGTGNPIGSPQVTALSDKDYIHKTLTYQGHKFQIQLGRAWNNAKIKVRYIQVALYVEGFTAPFISSGNLPDKTFASGKGWLKEMLDNAIKGYEELPTSL